MRLWTLYYFSPLFFSSDRFKWNWLPIKSTACLHYHLAVLQWTDHRAPPAMLLIQLGQIKARGSVNVYSRHEKCFDLSSLLYNKIWWDHANLPITASGKIPCGVLSEVRSVGKGAILCHLPQFEYGSRAPKPGYPGGGIPGSVRILGQVTQF